MSGPFDRLCGQLIVGGFEGSSLPAELARPLREGHRAGVILFKRNIVSLEQTHALCAEVVRLCPSAAICVDQEGGRVQRLGPPVLQLPPMRRFGVRDAVDLIEAGISELGLQLASIGFNVDFAPVLDVDSNPENPVIGDRAFGREPETVERFGGIVARILQDSGLAACGKHFPGHGDTDKDSHLDLPVVAHSLERLERIEFAPFRHLASTLEAMMSAHVVYSAFDAERPATLVPEIAEDLLRRVFGFQGVLFSDDLQMRAVADRYAIEPLAVGAVRAGCDVLLICRSTELQERAHRALAAECARDSVFRHRCEVAAARSSSLRRRFPARPLKSSNQLRALLQRFDAARLQGRLDALTRG